MSKWENLKPGTTLIVRGNYMYDKYEHDFVILPYDVLQVERQQRQDTAPDGESASSCTCIPSPAQWTASTTRAKLSAWPTVHGPPRYRHH